METLKFKTNINCNGCVRAVTPTLDNEKEVSEWEVDIQSSNKVLSVKTEHLTKENIIELVKKAGFEAEDYT